MKQKLRLLLAFFSFFQFFTAGVLLGVVFFPLVRLFVWRRARYRRLASRFLGVAHLGLLIGVSLLAAVAADLFLSPLLIRTFLGRSGGSPPDAPAAEELA